jgi:hypothetical protein
LEMSKKKALKERFYFKAILKIQDEEKEEG